MSDERELGSESCRAGSEQVPGGNQRRVRVPSRQGAAGEQLPGGNSRYDAQRTISAQDVRNEAYRRTHRTDADGPKVCLKCWLIETADTIESLQAEVEKLRDAAQFAARVINGRIQGRSRPGDQADALGKLVALLPDDVSVAP